MNFLFAKQRLLTAVLAVLTFAGGARSFAQTEHTIYFFSETQIVDSQAGLIADSSGALYGTTSFGGSASDGTVYKLSPPAAPGAPWKGSVLYTFTGGGDGATPFCSLVLDSHGALYGTTLTGGVYGWTAFQLEPPSVPGGAWTENVIYSADGAVEAGLAMDATGALYGATTSGEIFQLVPPAIVGGGWDVSSAVHAGARIVRCEQPHSR
jgi:uncharacterized repeat protein (TIGR03803 family)